MRKKKLWHAVRMHERSLVLKTNLVPSKQMVLQALLEAELVFEKRAAMDADLSQKVERMQAKPLKVVLPAHLVER